MPEKASLGGAMIIHLSGSAMKYMKVPKQKRCLGTLTN